MIASLPGGSVLIAAGADDDVVFHSRLPDWSKEMCRRALERGDITVIADDDFTATSDDMLTEITAGFPIPFRLLKKMRAWADAGVSGITEHHTGGASFGVNSVNDFAWRIFSWNPYVDEESAEAEIRGYFSILLGNDEAADKMILACRFIDKALDILEDNSLKRPYWDRLWHSLNTIIMPSHVIMGVKRQGIDTSAYLVDGVSPEYRKNTLEAETDYFKTALTLAREAEAIASCDYSPDFLYWRGSEGHSCAEFAACIRSAIEIYYHFKISFSNSMLAEYYNDSERASISESEAENNRLLLSVLAERKCWIQSPGGHSRLEKIPSIIAGKLHKYETIVRS